MRLSILHQWFKFDVIRFTGYGIIAQKSRVDQLDQIFPCALRKNHALDRKMNKPFLMASTSTITMQSLGKIVQRTPAGRAKIWCLSLCFLAVQNFTSIRVSWECGPKYQKFPLFGRVTPHSGKRTHMPVGSAKFEVNRCNESPPRGEKPDFWPVSKFNTAVCRFAASCR